MWAALRGADAFPPGRPQPPLMSLAAASRLATAPTGAAVAATPLPRVRADVIFQTVPEGAVLLATRDEIYYGLNEVGAEIWTLLVNAPRSLEDLCARLGLRYPDVPLHTLRADVLELLADLAVAGLVDASQPSA